jgi:hypothetical protein
MKLYSYGIVISTLADSHCVVPYNFFSRHETICFNRIVNKPSFKISPLDDKLAPVGILEGVVELEEGDPNLLRKKPKPFGFLNRDGYDESRLESYAIYPSPNGPSSC